MMFLRADEVEKSLSKWVPALRRGIIQRGCMDYVGQKFLALSDGESIPYEHIRNVITVCPSRRNMIFCAYDPLSFGA